MLTVYKKYQSKIVDFDNTMAFAQRVSNGEFNGNVKVQTIEGFLTDNYHKGVISLSRPVAFANNASAISVCAHEMGHAMQYKQTPEKMKKFTKKLIFSNVTSKFTFPLFLIGIPFIFFNIIIAMAIFAFSLFTFIVGLLTKISTIKIENEATQNAFVLLKKYADFDQEQIKYAKKVLSAARLTYVASFLKSVLRWTFLVRKYDFI